MKWLFFFFGFTLIVCGAFLFWLKYARPSVPLHAGQIKIDGHLIEVEVADTILTRERGLSGRNGLPLNHGMLFIFPISGKYGFWMRDMKFPIDIVWIKNDTVVGVTQQVYPDFKKSFWQLPIYNPPEAIDKVLEVTAGTVALHSWHAGSVVQFPVSEVK